MRYTEGSWVIFSCFEAEREGVLPWRDKRAPEVIQDVWKPGDDSASGIPLEFHDLIAPFDVVVLDRLIMILIFWIRAIHPNLIILHFSMPDHMRMHILPLMFKQSPFLNPPGTFPSLKFNHNLVSIDRFSQIEIDMTWDSISCKVEWFIELNESWWHWIISLSTFRIIVTI